MASQKFGVAIDGEVLRVVCVSDDHKVFRGICAYTYSEAMQMVERIAENFNTPCTIFEL